MPPHQRPRQVPAAPNLLLVKDSAELVEGILCVTAQCRDVLRRILADVDGSLCNGSRCPAARIALDGHGDVRGKTFCVYYLHKSLYIILFTIILAFPCCILHKICVIFFISQFTIQTKLPNTFYISRRKHFSDNLKFIIPSQLY